MVLITRPGLEEVIQNDKYFIRSADLRNNGSALVHSRYLDRAIFELEYLVRQSKWVKKHAFALIGRPIKDLTLQKLCNVQAHSAAVYVPRATREQCPDDETTIATGPMYFDLNRRTESNIFAVQAYHYKKNNKLIPTVCFCVLVPLEDQTFVPLKAGSGRHQYAGGFLIKGRGGARIDSIAPGLDTLADVHLRRVANLVGFYKKYVLGINNTHFKKLD